MNISTGYPPKILNNLMPKLTLQGKIGPDKFGTKWIKIIHDKNITLFPAAVAQFKMSRKHYPKENCSPPVSHRFLQL